MVCRSNTQPSVSKQLRKVIVTPQCILTLFHRWWNNQRLQTKRSLKPNTEWCSTSTRYQNRSGQKGRCRTRLGVCYSWSTFPGYIRARALSSAMCTPFCRLFGKHSVRKQSQEHSSTGNFPLHQRIYTGSLALKTREPSIQEVSHSKETIRNYLHQQLQQRFKKNPCFYIYISQVKVTWWGEFLLVGNWIFECFGEVTGFQGVEGNGTGNTGGDREASSETITERSAFVHGKPGIRQKVFPTVVHNPWQDFPPSPKEYYL